MIIDTHVHIGGRFEESPNSWVTFERYQKLSKELNAKFIGMSCELSLDTDYIQENKRTLAEIKKDSETFAGMYLFVNPNNYKIEDLEKQITSEVKGLKILRYSNHPEFKDEDLDKIIKFSIEKKIAIMFHGGRASKATKLTEYAIKHPESKIIIAHFGGPSPDLQQEGIKAVQMSDNIWLETTFAPCYLNSIEKVLELGYKDRIIFGSDYPLHDMKALVAAMRSHNFEKKIYNKIMFENANSLFKLKL